MKRIRVKLTEIVTPTRGDSKYTKEYGAVNSGEYPVYSASNSEPLTYINSFDFDGDFLTWTTNGFGGFLKILSGKFSINGDRGVLIPKEGVNVDLQYLKYALQPILREKAKGRRGDKGKNEFTKVPLAIIKKVEIEIPANSNGEYDLALQSELIKKYKAYEKLKTVLISKAEQVNKAAIDIPISEEALLINLEDIFDLDTPTNSSHFTKRFVNENKGDIPVYSASQESESVGYGYVKNGLPNVKYFRDTLTWNIDGSVGKAFYREGAFSLSEKVIPLVLKAKWENLIDYHYVKYVLEEKAVERGFEFSNKAGKSRISDIEIPIPVKISDGDKIPDMEKQIKLAKQYELMYSLKERFIQEIEKLGRYEMDLFRTS